MLFNSSYHVIKQNGDIIRRNIGYWDAINYCTFQDVQGCYGQGYPPSMRKGNKFIIWSPSAGKAV